MPSILGCTSSCDSLLDGTDSFQVGITIAAERAHKGGGSDQIQIFAAVKEKELLESRIVLAAYIHLHWLLSDLALPPPRIVS